MKLSFPNSLVTQQHGYPILTAEYVATVGLHFIFYVVQAHWTLVLLAISSSRLNFNFIKHHNRNNKLKSL